MLRISAIHHAVLNTQFAVPTATDELDWKSGVIRGAFFDVLPLPVWTVKNPRLVRLSKLGNFRCGFITAPTCGDSIHAFPKIQNKIRHYNPMHSTNKLIRSFWLLLFAGVLAAATPSGLAQNSQVAEINRQIAQLKVEIETLKLGQLQDTARRDTRAAQAKTARIQYDQNQITILTMQLSLAQQELSFQNQPKSPIQAVAACQYAIEELTIQKGQLGIEQAKANQAGQQARANFYAQQIAKKQQDIQIKQQEMKVLEIQSAVKR